MVASKFSSILSKLRDDNHSTDYLSFLADFFGTYSSEGENSVNSGIVLEIDNKKKEFPFVRLLLKEFDVGCK